MKNIVNLLVLLVMVWMPVSAMSAPPVGSTAPVANDLTRAEAMLPGGETAGDLMTPTPTDISMKVIRAILGGDMSTSSTTLPIIGDAMLVFNIIMLAIGSFIFTGVAVSGILRTGADGEALGKKWSNMWVPLRFGASTALLIPTGSGFSVGQVMTMAAIAMGVGAGDSVWKAASTSAVTRMGELNAYNQRINPDDIDMAKAILKNELCLKNFERYTAAQAKKLNLPPPVKYVREVDLKTGAIYWSAIDIRTTEMLSNPAVTTIMPNGGGKAAVEKYRGLCGSTQEFLPIGNQLAITFAGAATPASGTPGSSKPSATTPAPNTPKQDSILAGNTVSGSVTVTLPDRITLPNNANGIINVAMQKMSLKVKQAQQLGVYNAAVLLSNHADKIAANYTVYEVPAEGTASAATSSVAAAPTLDFTSKDATIVKGETEIALNNAVQEYKRAVATAVSIATNNEELTKKMVADANESGWASSGIWFYQLARIASDVKKNMDVSTKVFSTEIQAGSGNPPPESISTANTAADDDILRNPSWMRILKAALGGSEGAIDLFWQKIYYNTIGETGDPGFMQRWFGYNPRSTDHPLIQMQQSGLIMLDTGLVIKAIKYSGDFAADTISNTTITNFASKITGLDGVKTAATNLFKELLSALNYIAPILIVAGVVKAFIIPLLPFMKLLKAVVMFFITVCEVLVATPLWIAFHMTPDGDGFASERVQGGYGIVLEAALRPMLIVFGLLFAFLLMWPVMNLFAEMFVMATDVTSQGVEISRILTPDALRNSSASTAGVAVVAGGVATVGAIASPAIATVGGVAVAGLFLNKLVMMFVYLVLFISIAYLIVDKCCDVIDILPANVMNWINVRSNGGNSNMDDRVRGITDKLEGNASPFVNGMESKHGKRAGLNVDETNMGT